MKLVGHAADFVFGVIRGHKKCKPLDYRDTKLWVVPHEGKGLDAVIFKLTTQVLTAGVTIPCIGSSGSTQS